jgi:NAD(P)-dependent dehydrogenase (short-subunit alcohol dehydrogenase family)
MATLRRQRSRTPLTGRTVLITGAARGIGAELAGVAAELGPEHL